MDLDDVPVPRRDAVDTNGQSEVGVGDSRQTGVGFRCPASRLIRIGTGNFLVFYLAAC